MNEERRAILLMLLTGVLWSIGGVLIKLTPWNALVIAGMRSAITAVVMIAYMRHQKLRIEVTKQTLAIGAATFGVFALFLSANKMTTSANAIVLQYTGPIYVLIFSAVFHKAPVRKGDLIAVMLTMAGIALFFFDQLGSGSLAGNVLGLISGVFFALMFFLTGGVSEQTRMSGLLMGQFISALVGIPLAFVYETPVTPVAVICILLLGVVQLGIPYILYNMAVKRCTPLMCSIIAVAEPLLNPVWVYLATGERPGKWALLGAAVVLATVTLWCVWGEKQKQRETSAAVAASVAMENEQ